MQQYDVKYENVDEAAKTLKPNITDLKVSFLHEVGRGIFAWEQFCLVIAGTVVSRDQRGVKMQGHTLS